MQLSLPASFTTYNTFFVLTPHMKHTDLFAPLIGNKDIQTPPKKCLIYILVCLNVYEMLGFNMSETINIFHFKVSFILILLFFYHLQP